MELRDYSTSTCSQPVKSKRLQAVFQAQRTRRPVPPSLHNANAVAEVAHSHTEEQRLIQLCQKPSEQRTQQDVELVRSLVGAMCPFLTLWPPLLQDEIARLLTTEVRVQRESVLTRGVVPTSLFIIVSGTLHVLGPSGGVASGMQTDTSIPASAASQSNQRGGSSTRQQPHLGSAPVVAHLGKGDTCGETTLVGAHASSATVVVGSKGAVLLALPHDAFVRGFKELLGLRQQDRLEFLLRHPACTGLSLGELDTCAQLLQPAQYDPGEVLLPLPGGSSEGHRTLMLADGRVSVRRANGHNGSAAAGFHPSSACTGVPAGRSTGGHSATQPRADAGGGAGVSGRLYDRDTVSVLHPPAVIHSHSVTRCIVTALEPARVYWVHNSQLDQLPTRLRSVLTAAGAFLGGYQAGRADGLNQLDARRSLQARGVVHPAVIPASQSFTKDMDDDGKSALPGPASAVNGGGSDGTFGATAAGLHGDHATGQDGNLLVSPREVRRRMLEGMAAQQVLAALDTGVRRDAKTGLYTSNLERLAVGNQEDGGPIHDARGRRACANDASRHPCDSLPAKAKNPSKALIPASVLLLPHGVSRRAQVVTETPRPQHVPVSLSQRHALIHHRAVMAAAARRIAGGSTSSGEDDIDIAGGDLWEPNRGTGGSRAAAGSGWRGRRQPSRQLSGSNGLPHRSSQPCSPGDAVIPVPCPAPWRTAGMLSTEPQQPQNSLVLGPPSAGSLSAASPRSQPSKSDGSASDTAADVEHRSESQQHRHLRPVRAPAASDGLKHDKAVTPPKLRASPRQPPSQRIPGVGRRSHARSQRAGAGNGNSEEGHSGDQRDQLLKSSVPEASQPLHVDHSGAANVDNVGSHGQSHGDTGGTHTQAICLPPCVALGYEKLDPVQWAALGLPLNTLGAPMGLTGGPIRAAATGNGPRQPLTTTSLADSLLPPPNW